MSKSIIDPRTVLVAMPTITGQNHTELTGSLIACAMKFRSFFPLMECSHPSLARNVIAEVFMSNTNCEWLVCVDSDIAFHPQDFDILMETVDSSIDYSAPGQVAPTRVTTALCEQGQPIDHKMMATADALVCAQYRYKRDDYDVVRLGMGFVRIHRSVFEALQKLEHEKNPLAEEYDAALVELDTWSATNARERQIPETVMDVLRRARPDAGGGPRLWQAQRDGRLIWDYFPSGPILSQYLPTAEWKGEDHGFFTLCMLAGIIPRIETRTRLTHIGRKGYIYEGPDGGIGQ